MDYMWTHPDAKIRYYASDMVLNVHSDASYLSAADAKSRAAGFFFLGSIPINSKPIKLNGAIHVLCTILKFVAASAAEAELGALFLNAKEAKVMRLTLEELGHPQPPTPIHIDNSTTVGIVNNTVKRQKSCSMEMRYFWLLDGHNNKIFDFQYYPGFERILEITQAKPILGGITSMCDNITCTCPLPLFFLIRAVKPSVRRGCVEQVDPAYIRKQPLPALLRIPSVASRNLVSTAA